MMNEDCYPLTKEAYLKFQNEIYAWANGAQLQYRIERSGETWYDIKENENPNWIKGIEYRIKPTEFKKDLKELIENTLSIDINAIGSSNGKTISKDEMFSILKVFEAKLKPQLNCLLKDRNIQMVIKPENN